MKHIIFALLLCVASASAYDPCDKFNVKTAHKLDYFVGDSMLPAIHPGDDVYYKRYSPLHDVKVGQVLVLRYKHHKNVYENTDGFEPTWVVHRVANINKGAITVKGDNNEEADPVTFKRKDIVGFVCEVRR